LKKAAYVLLVVFIIAEIIFSFVQHYHISLDGDLANIVLPDPGYQKVLDDPFGVNVFLNDAVYPATNRYFAHWFQLSYFRNMPLFLQHFTDPINSIYLSCSIAKTGIQFMMIFLLAFFITGSRGVFKRDFLLASALITPLFQTFGYNGYMGIIDHSITYSFFYALASLLLLLFFLPFFIQGFHQKEKKLNVWSLIGLLILTFILPFHGPLNSAVILIVCPMIFLIKWWSNYKKLPEEKLVRRAVIALKDMPLQLSVFFVLASVLSLYSLYIGRNNSENFWVEVSLLERYSRLPMGLYYQLTQKLGLPLLLGLIIINTSIIWKGNIHKQKLVGLLKWIILFSVIYLLLLPLGGYREYRPNIIRRDTIMPIILAMISFFGISSFYILRHIRLRKNFYYAGIIVFEIIFIAADAKIQDHNSCERKALYDLASSSEKEVVLEDDCNVMSWGNFKDFQSSKNNTSLLLYWGVINEEKLYRHK